MAKKNIIASFGVKGLSMINGFLLVTVTLHFLDQTRYGIWVTISSMFVWLSFLDVGLGQGLRNKLAEAIALGDTVLARKYVSTSYALLGMIILGALIVYLFIHPYLNWYRILNTDSNTVSELGSVGLIVFVSFFLRFFLQLFINVLYAHQRSALAGSFGPISNFCVLIVIFVLTKVTSGSLFVLAVVQSVIPLVILLFFTIYFFCKDFSQISPNFKFVDFKYTNEILSLGVQFFLISFGKIIRYQSANILISQLFGPSQVTPYAIAFKYFGMLSMGFSIVLTPMWSAYTEAWTQNDMKWINSSLKKLNRLIFYFSLLGILALLASPFVFEIWVGKEVEISFYLSFLMLIYNITYAYGGIYSSIANGIGKVRIQMILSIIASILYIPMVLFFVKYLHFGIESIILSTILTNWYGPIVGPFHIKKVLLNKITLGKHLYV